MYGAGCYWPAEDDVVELTEVVCPDSVAVESGLY